MERPYANTREYVDDYRALLALRLHREVLLTRLLRGSGTDEAFLGLFLSEEEVDSILAGLHGVALPRDGQVVGLEAEIAGLEGQIQARLAVTDRRLRTESLAELFDLSPAAVQVMMLLLAPEVDNRFGRVYAYLQDDVSRRWLSPGLVLRLLPDVTPDDPAGRALFAPESPLIQERLVRLGDEGASLPAPLMDRALKLDDRIAECLLEHDALDPRLAGIAALDGHGQALEDLPLDPALRARLEHLLAVWRTAPAPWAFFWGPGGSGKATVVAALAGELGCPLLTVDARALAAHPAEKISSLLHAAHREARLRRGLLHVRQIDALPEGSRAELLRLGAANLILSARDPVPTHDLADPPLVIQFPIPAYELREQLWQAALNVGAGSSRPAHPGLPGELAGRFQLTPGQIARAALAAEQRAWLREGPGARPDRNDLFEGCRLQSNPALAQLAVKVASPYTWEDLVLPAAQMAQLRAIESQVRHAHTVYQQWGFGAKLALGKGLSALFSGPSGTGKTMAAGILAKSLGLDMYKIDLSGVVSKYIGETEKNLSRIFDQASTANVILFFDEADALFGKRSEVKDAHDRYANIEISYLLQKMEEYAGVSILATNLSQNLDEAFTRRMQFVVDFPFPGAEDRARIWRGMFPNAAPRAGDIDFSFLATQFELSGGNIKNCVLAAAFLAAEDGAVITMDHLVQGVARELGKLGRPLQRADFGEYYGVARLSRHQPPVSHG